MKNKNVFNARQIPLSPPLLKGENNVKQTGNIVYKTTGDILNRCTIILYHVLSMKIPPNSLL